MRHSARGPRSELPGFNMTPMIDVVFLLIIFFMLVSQFSSAENVEVELPEPERSQAIEATVPEKLILNIEYVGPDEPPGFLLGSIRPCLGSKANLIMAGPMKSPRITGATKKTSQRQTRSLSTAGLRRSMR